MSDFNNLVPLIETTINGKLKQTVSAKQLHNCLQVGRDFSNWIKGRIKQYAFIQGEDYISEETVTKMRWLGTEQDYSPDLMNQSLNNKQYSTNLAKNTQQSIAKECDPNSGYVDQYYSNLINPRRGRPEKEYILTLNMAKELAMIENNDQGHAIRRYFIRCEEQLRNVAPTIHKSELKRLKARLEAASYTRPMCDALTLSRLRQDKETKPHHYKNEYDMLNGIVLGMPAKGYRKSHGLTGEIRDHFNEKQICHLSYLERSNITLLELGWVYQQRKAELTKLSQIYLSRHMDGVSQ